MAPRLTKDMFSKEVRAVMKAMDDSADTAKAITEIVVAVYKLGVKRGAKEGYEQALADMRNNPGSMGNNDKSKSAA